LERKTWFDQQFTRLEKFNKMRIQKHSPNEYDSPPIAEFQTVDELFGIDWIKSFTDIHDFYKFSISKHPEYNGSIKDLLISEYEEGRKWWVVGYFLDESPDLPLWKPNKQHYLK
jgi:hypothetical protein